MSEKDVDVVIVGAGTAGLAALRDLDRGGKRVLCLEARSRIGGRIRTIHDRMSPIPIELGAEFVHGKPPEILKIAESAPLTLYDCTERAMHIRDGKPVKNKDAWLQVDQVMEGLKAAVKKGRDETFSEFLEQSSYSKDAKELATSYVEGFNAARAELISIASLVQDAEAADEIDGDKSFRLMNGYEAIPRWLTQGMDDLGTKLKLNCAVQAIRWKRGTATVEFLSRDSSNVQTITAKQAVITVPLGVLQAAPGLLGAIEFDPEPTDILAAARQLCFGHVVRLILRFRQVVWEEKGEFANVGFLLSTEKHFPTWWTPLPVRARSITGWSAGPHADELLGLGKSEIVLRALHDLSRILSTSAKKLSEQLESSYFHDWHGDPFARGAYSYVPAHAMNARGKLARAVDGTLYFAGEATEINGHSATVHGAIASGCRAARQILND
ncbi:MAG TPA: NAD(P)/FAD-dependent oxidoreductase [Bryobacteraceae bacterium]|nr:NAD(P)/FAD-dependent oxidoreductase [Bryobacteraceae bacterium]